MGLLLRELDPTGAEERSLTCTYQCIGIFQLVFRGTCFCSQLHDMKAVMNDRFIGNFQRLFFRFAVGTIYAHHDGFNELNLLTRAF